MSPSELSIRRIFKTWWPLAASWLLMSAELPAVTATIARLPDAKVNLAAYGGVVFPLALIVEAPVIMLLAASTALSKDWDSYQKLRRFMIVSGAVLTAIHILISFTPLYYIVVESIIGVPPEVVEPARIGLMIMTPWTWSIAYRRFNQGVLIRFGRSETVGVGTVIRLSADLLVLVVGYSIGNIPGIVVGTSAVAAGVVAEAIYSGIVVRPVVRGPLKSAPPLSQALTWRAFFDFYIPLALTSLIFLLAQPIGSAALSRMPQALASLAAWSVISGLIFIFRSPGIAYNEVVVALMDEPLSFENLRRFTNWLAALTTIALIVTVVTPISTFWFARITSLPSDLLPLTEIALWLALPIPAMAVFQSWYQGAMLHRRRTRGITVAVIIYLIVNALALSVGVFMGTIAGLYVALVSMGIAMFAQTAWLWWRSRNILSEVRQRDDQEYARQISQVQAAYSGQNSVAD